MVNEIKENVNDEMIENLEYVLNSKGLSKEFKNVINKKTLNCEKIVAVALVPIVVKIYENDGKENKKILVKKYGFNLCCETEKSTPMGYTYTFVFNDAEKIKSNMKMIEQQNVFEIYTINENEWEKASLFYAKEYLDYEFNGIKTEMELIIFLLLSSYNKSFIFKNKKDWFSIKTQKLKNNWKNNIKTSEQVEKIKTKKLKKKEN